MSNKKAATFCKREVCPSAEKLLAFHRSELSKTAMRETTNHLCECEFCSTELYFLAVHPPAEETSFESEMPAALRQLAEVLLGGKQKEYRLLNQLLGEKEFLTLKSA